MTISLPRVPAAVADPVLRARDGWARGLRELCAALCWPLLVVHFGLVCLLVRTVLLAHREWRARRTRGRTGAWWTRLGLGDAAEAALDALGLPGVLVRYSAVAGVWLCGRVRRTAKSALDRIAAARGAQ
ncbi:hypothetical protein ACQPZF_23920 [Actinosynnema sp. CS-041913]|uniref:hypothetical protein n=1 Tax=Actinosynnema sp. CS-041913 TaxID=3239917 RepID=UPI003D92103E